MSNNVNVNKLLNSPLEYWLNIQDKKSLEELKDRDGLNVMHWCILNQNVPKMKELLKLKFDFTNSYSTHNRLPSIKLEEIKKKSLEVIHNLDKYSPMQLCMFLVDYYDLKEEGIKEFKADLAYKHYLSMFAILIEDMDLSSEQSNEFSLLDYAFLLENTTLIKMLQKKDTSYSSLNKINSSVALRILETMKVKYSKLNIIIEELSKGLIIRDNYTILDKLCKMDKNEEKVKKLKKL